MDCMVLFVGRVNGIECDMTYSTFGLTGVVGLSVRLGCGVYGIVVLGGVDGYWCCG